MNFLPKHFNEGKTEGTERRGRGRKQLLNDHMEEIRCLKLKAESVNNSLRRSRFGRGYVTCSKTDYAMHEWCTVSFPLKMEAAGFFFSPKRCYVFNVMHFPVDHVRNIESSESLRCPHVNTVYKQPCPWISLRLPC